jgi:ribose/xylose/arabinose/galactoside ABC-type transport system permease subunit
MTAIARVLSRAFFSTSDKFDVLQQIASFCAASLLVSLLLLIYGVDLSPGFF